MYVMTDSKERMFCACVIIFGLSELKIIKTHLFSTTIFDLSEDLRLYLEPVINKSHAISAMEYLLAKFDFLASGSFVSIKTSNSVASSLIFLLWTLCSPQTCHSDSQKDKQNPHFYRVVHTTFEIII